VADSLDIAQKIQARCDRLLEIEAKYYGCLDKRNHCQAAYDAAFAVALIKFQRDGVKMTIIDKLARHATKVEYLALATAEAKVKGNESGKRILSTTILALQTLFPKHSYL
jgi:hypothetical protein